VIEKLLPPRNLSIVIAIALGVSVLHAPAWGQGFPNRPVRVILAQTTGTTPDVLARTLAPRLQARMGQPFIVDNRAGAAGAIGMEALAKAPPDGYTININVSSTLTLPLFFKVPFDVLTSFAPITMIGNNLFALSVHPSVPATTAPAFISWAKERGAQVNYGSPGNGTYHHLFMEKFKLQTGLDMTHIPYKGSAQAFTDLMGGQINAMFLPMGVAVNLAKDGKVRILGGSGRERSAITPNVPSLHEVGVSNFHAFAWFAAWGPSGMPADIVNRFNTEIRAILAEPEVQDILAKQGIGVQTSTPAELDRTNRAEYETLAKLVRDAKIKGD
jgi:tripartite-type tricarboxylate transporter receptor subunit TctC